MKEILWEKQKVCADNGEACGLEYYLLVEEIPISNSIFLENYGVKLCLQKGAERDSAAISNISPNGEKMTQLLELLSQNFVTPAALSDVVEDWLLFSA